MITESYVKGFAELKAAMQDLPAKIEGNVMQGALRAGLKVMEAEAKAGVPVKDGHLRDSIKIVSKAKSKRFGWVRLHLVAGNSKAWYAHLVEFGTASFYVGRGKSVRKPYVISAVDDQGKRFGPAEKRRLNRLGSGGKGGLHFFGKVRRAVVHPGAKPKPFMRPALDRSQAAAINAVREYIARRLPRELKKAGL